MRIGWTSIAILAILAVFSSPGAAQTADPGNEIETKFELGVGGVFVDVDGSEDKFRTERNVRSGFNTKNLYLDLRPAGETETFFDLLTLSAVGIGSSSPYQRGDLRAGKRRLYDLKAGYRKYNYFFGLPEFALGWHREDSVGRSGNISLDLFPDRKASFFVGYRRNQLYGTHFTSQDIGPDAYPGSSPRRLASDEIFGGVKLKSRTASLNFTQSYLRFKDDQQLFPNGDQSIGLRGNTLVGGQRDTPVRISNPITRVLGRYRPSKRYDVTGRYMYSGADVDVSRWENLLQTIGQGQFPLRQIISSTGVSEKPSHNASFAQSFDITDRLTFRHRFVYETYSITGLLDTTGLLRMINAVTGQELDQPFVEMGGTATDYQLVRNEAELEYSVVPSVALLGGYRYSDRHLAFGDTGTNPRPVVTIAHTGGGGVLWRPSAKALLRADVEKGASSLAFNRIDPLETLRWKIKGRVRPTSRLTISASGLLEDNSNNAPNVNYDLDNRQLGAQAVYVPSNRLMLSGGYNYLRIRTSTDIVFWALSQLTEATSLYETNTHVANVLVQAPVGNRVNLRAGYEYFKDSGSTYPLRMHIPRVGLSLRLQQWIHLDADWRYYSYAERISTIRDYRANVLYIGLRYTR